MDDLSMWGAVIFSALMILFIVSLFLVVYDARYFDRNDEDLDPSLFNEWEDR